VHMFLWLTAPPDPADYDRMVQATVPKGADAASLELRQLVLRYQVHECRERCKKGQKPGDPPYCCFSFPAPLAATTHLKDSNMRFSYRRSEEEDRRIVPYNAALLKAWGGHLNVQLTTGTSMDRYGTKYISKAEPELFAALAEGENRFQRYLKLRVVSLCEVAAYLAGFHPVQGTREVINVNTNPDEEMWRALKRKKDLQMMTAEGNQEKPTLPTARDKYCERPDDLEDLTVVEFTEKYEVFLRFETIPVSRREDAAHDHAGRWVARRNKEVVARWQYLLPEDGERFYLQQLILKVPFRSTEFLNPGNVSRTLKEECVLRGIMEQGEDAEQDLKRQIESEYGIPGIRWAARKLAAKVLKGEDLDEMEGDGDGERTGPGALGLDQFTTEISEAGMETEHLRKIWNPIVREMVAMNQKLTQKGKLTASQARVLAHVTEHLARRALILGGSDWPRWYWQVVPHLHHRGCRHPVAPAQRRPPRACWIARLPAQGPDSPLLPEARHPSQVPLGRRNRSGRGSEAWRLIYH